MKYNIYNQNPKALNLSAVQESNKKVTLGFKCTPQLKLLLAQKAANSGLTLSAYVESFLENSDKSIIELTQRVQQLTNENIVLSQKNSFYENDILKALEKSYKGKKVSYINSNGETLNLVIQSLGDVYTVMVNSFK
jgi:hypothetical protein